MSGRNNFVVFTDGACLGNPGKGGYAALIINKQTQERYQVFDGFEYTTNVRMELMSIVEALDSILLPSDIHVYSDSQFIVNSINDGSLDYWSNNNYVGTGGRRIKNVDLWNKLLDSLLYHRVSFSWIKGHSGIAENEDVDKLAKYAASTMSNKKDLGYIDREVLEVY